jgi:cytochrome c biogenesis protein CcmG, thiol:disulfide interchange protein DsbE
VRASNAFLACATVLSIVACGSASTPPPAPPAPAGRAAKTGSSPELARLRGQADRLLGGGPAAFRAQLRALHGHPVVVNKWASWCPPCRAEFPFLRDQARRRAGRVAFLGVNSQDADADAAEFLRRNPVGYPSYRDPDMEVARVFKGTAAFPTTAFYDARGRLAYFKQGGYATEAKLAEDIERYALR